MIIGILIHQKKFPILAIIPVKCSTTVNTDIKKTNIQAQGSK